MLASDLRFQCIMSFHKPQSLLKFFQHLGCFECILTIFRSFCISELSRTFIYRSQAFRKYPDSVYTASHVIPMRLMRCAPNLHYNKVDIIHKTATVVDKEKNGYRLEFTLFLSYVNLGLFRFRSVTQRKPLALALRNAFSNSD